MSQERTVKINIDAKEALKRLDAVEKELASISKTSKKTAEGTSANATSVDYTKGFFDCTTMSIGGDDVVLNKFDITISNPATRVGYSTVNSITHEPSAYNRGGQISVTGNVSAKLDDNVTDTIADFRAGTSVNISIGDGAAIDFDIPTAKYTGYSHTNTENGVFIDLPFMGTADGSNALVTIIAT